MPIGQSKAVWKCMWCNLVATNASVTTWWPTLEPMQVVPPDDQILNKCKWRHLVAKIATDASKFVINASGAIWWPNLRWCVVPQKHWLFINKWFLASVTRMTPTRWVRWFSARECVAGLQSGRIHSKPRFLICTLFSPRRRRNTNSSQSATGGIWKTSKQHLWQYWRDHIRGWKSAPHCFKVFSPTTKIKSLPVQLECSSLSRPVPQFRIHCRLAIYGPLPPCRGPHLNSLPLPLTSFSQPHPFCSCPKTHKRSEYLPTKILDFLQSLRQHWWSTFRIFFSGIP